jgi:type II secretory ATPase GspE/PulE/Tfp pilus assembly ATPase PilB-like protein
MVITDAELYQRLAELEYLAPGDLEKAKLRAQTEGISLYDALLTSDLISDENLGRLVADSLQLPFVSLAQVQIPDTVLRLLPQTVAAQYHAIVFGRTEHDLQIATTDPHATDLFAMVAKKAGVAEYHLFYATERDIERAVGLYRKEMASVFQDLLSTNADKPKELPVAKIVNTIIEYAYVSKVSDIHIEPTRTDAAVRFRIDGVLHDVVRLPRTVHDQVLARIKVLARLRTDEHFSAQDGRMHIELSEETIDIRVSVVPVVAGEKAVLRLLSSHFQQFGLTDLGMNDADLKKVNAGFRRPFGMLLSTGPTGSGKTTSMYAILKILNIREKNIATIEDPVEYEMRGINQIQANTKTNLTFANGLRSILRQDPDIIYVGEIRDEETADIAVNAALTGHLVLSTLHTNNAATTLPRLIDMKIEPFLVASTVNTIIAQRLIRKICEHCKVSVEVTHTAQGWQGDDTLVAQLGALDPHQVVESFGSNTKLRLYRGKGCSVCHQTGYVGRIGIFEVLEVTPGLQALITQKANADQISVQAKREGMTTMMQDGLRKVSQGITSLEEVLRATQQ